MRVTERDGDLRRASPFRYGWLFAAIWLVYLGEPLNALIKHPADWHRVVGLAALALFAVAYLFFVSQGRRARNQQDLRPVAVRWAQVGILLALGAATIFGAAEHALTTLVYAAALAMSNLPVRQALAACLVIFAVAEALPRIVPGWEDTGYGLAVLLASIAVWGIRLAFERNQRLMDAQREVAGLAIENERARIAGELHDILGHSLTVVAVKAELAQRLLDVDLERARAELHDLEVLARDALADVRSTALGVRGVSLPGEIAAARTALAAAGVEAELPNAADHVPTQWRELFAWTIREAVTNLLRHSKASSCEIRLGAASVEVLDDGVGVGVVDSAAEDGLGLAGLRRRAEALGARMSAGDRPDRQGFHVLVEVGRD